jgi:purine-nucleoside phosphorylase
MNKPGIDDPSKAEAIAARLLKKAISAENVRQMIAFEDDNFDTTTFWLQVSSEAGVNFPSRKARERVAELLAGMENAHA